MFNSAKLKSERDEARAESVRLADVLRGRDQTIAVLQNALTLAQRERDAAEQRTKEERDERRRLTDKLMVLTGCGSIFAVEPQASQAEQPEAKDNETLHTNMREFVSEAELKMAKDLAEVRRRNAVAVERDKDFKAAEVSAEEKPSEPQIEEESVA